MYFQKDGISDTRRALCHWRASGGGQVLRGRSEAKGLPKMSQSALQGNLENRPLVKGTKNLRYEIFKNLGSFDIFLPGRLDAISLSSITQP